MKGRIVPPAELTAAAIRILCREIGVVNTIRFLNQFTNGSGNYTEERHRINGPVTVDEIMDEIERRRESGNLNISKESE
ncbi:MAG: hypothetical protein WBC44_11415 [Planctomycetaceae bacterium]